MLKDKIIPIALNENARSFAHLILHEGEAVLINAGSASGAARVLETIRDHDAVEKIQAVFLLNDHANNTQSLSALIDAGLEVPIYAPTTIVAADFSTRLFSETDHRYTFENGETLTLIRARFLPYPESHVAFYSGRNALFSDCLFSQAAHENKDKDALKKALRDYHEAHMPSSEFIRPFLQKMKSYPVKAIYPALGRPLKREKLNAALAEMRALEFHNTDETIYRKKGQRKTFQYVNLCNRMLRRLETFFDAEKIAAVFNDTAITLEKTPPLTIAETSLRGKALWERFFELIYEKEDPTWLNILEPSVKNLQKRFNVPKPAIYKSVTRAKDRAIAAEREETARLKDEIRTLRDEVKTTTEKLYRCPVTGLRNEHFFKERILRDLGKTVPEGKTRGFLVVHIDNLNHINRRYGKSSGDETLVNLSHLIEQSRHEDTQVYKQDGPGIIVYKDKTIHKNLMDFAIMLRNAVAEADLFVEPVSVSISIVTIDEIPEGEDRNARLKQLIDIATKRLEYGKKMGSGQIIDHDTDFKQTGEGMILLVDEEETSQNLMVQIFQRINYRVTIAKDIYDALEIVNTQPVDVIISEINLSKLDGFRLKSKLNETKEKKNVPFLIASHHKTKDVIRRCNMLGVDFVLQKPVIPEEITGIVRRFKERGRSS